MSIFKKQRKEEAIKAQEAKLTAFQEEFKVLSQKHGLDWAASLVKCPNCQGTGQSIQMHIVDLKK